MYILTKIYPSNPFQNSLFCPNQHLPKALLVAVLWKKCSICVENTFLVALQTSSKQKKAVTMSEKALRPGPISLKDLRECSEPERPRKAVPPVLDMLLRAALANRGNPFARYARKRIMARADWTEKELSGFVKPNVDKQGRWKGTVRVTALICIIPARDNGISLHSAFNQLFRL